MVHARHRLVRREERRRRARVVATCRGMRRCSVSRPCRIWNAVIGAMQAPKSRRPSRRARSRKAETVRFLGEHHAVEALVGLGERREFARGVPVEAPAVDQHAADHHAVAGEELGRRMHHEVRAHVEGAAEARAWSPSRRRGAAMRVLARERRDAPGCRARPPTGCPPSRRRAAASPGRIARAPGVEVARGHEGGLDAEAGQGVGEQVVRAAVEARRGDDVPALAHEGGDGQVQGGLPARRGDGARRRPRARPCAPRRPPPSGWTAGSTRARASPC